MFKNYFKTAWRSLSKNKAYSALNILGLATGMAVALLIGLWVYYQFSYDKFLPGYQQVYVAFYRTSGNGDIYTQNSVAYPLADVLIKDIPANSTLQFKYLVPFDYLMANGGYGKDWGNNSYQTFVKLQPSVSYAQVDPKIKYLLKKYDLKDYENDKGEVFLYPLKDRHLISDFKNGVPSG